MKQWVILVGILFILVIGGYFLLSSYAVEFIQPRLQKGMGPGFILAEMKPKTTYLSVRGIQYEDPDSKQRFFEIEEVRIYPSLLSLLKKSLRIKEITIVQPSFFYYRSREGVIVGPWVTMKKEKDREGVSEEVKKKGNEETSGKGMNQEGRIDMEGWIDLKTMDLETSLKIREIEVEIFKPYYRKKVSVKIDSGTMDMESQIVLKEKRIDAPGELDFINLHIKQGGGTVFWIPAETLASLLEKKRNQVKVPFHVKGNLGDPQFNLQEAFLTRIAFSLAEALGLPVKSVGESISGDTGKGTEGWRAIEELFKKKKEKK